MPEFHRDMVERISRTMSDRLANVMYALENKIYKEGNAAEVRLYLEWALKWWPEVKIHLEQTGETTLSDDTVTRLAKEFERKLREVQTES